MPGSKKMTNVIAIDGPAASGKSTVAKRLAKELGITYINTGSLYRTVAYQALCDKQDLAHLSDAYLRTLEISYQGPDLCLNGKAVGDEIRTAEVAGGASLVATSPAVRNYLLDLQRNFAGERFIVMEGRDIGTVIFPDAKYKFFVTASPLVRAKRRFAQTGEVPSDASLDKVAREIAERDLQDSTRATAPLKQAADAVYVDTSNDTIDQVVDKIKAAVARDFAPIR